MSVARKRKSAPQDDAIEGQLRSHKHSKTSHTSTALPSIGDRRQASKSSVAVPNADSPRPTQKRKREQEDDTTQTCSKTKAARTNNTPVVRVALTPQTKHFHNVIPASPAETPGRKTARLFDRLELQARKHGANIGYDTPPATPEQNKLDFPDVLPAQLTKLVSLFAAFVSAINEQSAIGGADFRINLQDLLTTTTGIWRVRTVDMVDIRKILEVLPEKDLDWVLEDYERAGLCLTKRHTSTKSTTILDTIKLKRAFEDELRRQWAQWCKRDSSETDADVFVEQMPLLDIAKSDVVHKTASMFSRGKDRLDSLRQSQAAVKTAELEAKVFVPQATSVHTRGTNLLDRILAKQAASASMPAGPTREQLERRSSLQRVEEVCRVLDILSAGRARASFSMPSIVQQLQQSLRSPISRIEAERCLSIIAAEVMPQFVSVIASGNVNGIVITRAGKLGIAELKQRLAEVDV